MKDKIIAMIPARLGSKRVPKKNLRLIDGQPLIAYIIDSVIAAGVFDEIYLNSEAEIFGEIALEKGIEFYKRDSSLASDTATNDEFALDFINNVHGDILIQILPTSPLLSPQEIKAFVDEMTSKKLDTLISVEHKQIACVHNDLPINYDKYRVNPPSQEMIPVKAYSTALMGWRYENYRENMHKYNCAYHGGDGRVGYHEMRGLSTIDIDREEDFLLAESIIIAKKRHTPSQIQYYGETESDHSEVHVESILKRDGVKHSDLYDVNNKIVNLYEIMDSMDEAISWSKRVIDTESNSMTIISQLPGEGNRLHYHPNWNEWWFIVDGEWEWMIAGDRHIVRKGDIVFMEKNVRHKITAVGNKPAIRMAVSRADVAHVYPKGD
ncbi:MAG: cupin domain-containing protein [Candidatus Marinimicrobia bacterium]|nr:cupin domain-containing protein [Candidatus Neomarinimicrobiota bacterium]